MLKETSSETAAEAVKHFPKDRLRILSMLKVIFITQTRPEINTSSGLFGPCLHRAVSVQTFNHIHFYKPVCLINSLRRRKTRDSAVRTPFGLGELVCTLQIYRNCIVISLVTMYFEKYLKTMCVYFSFLQSKICMLHHGRLSNEITYNESRTKRADIVSVDMFVA